MTLKSEGKSFSFSIHSIICLSFLLTMPLSEHIRHCNLICRGIQLDMFSSLLVRRKSLATQLSRRFVHIHFITFSDMFKMMNHINRKYWLAHFPRKRKRNPSIPITLVCVRIVLLVFCYSDLNGFKNSVRI